MILQRSHIVYGMRRHGGGFLRACLTLVLLIIGARASNAQGEAHAGGAIDNPLRRFRFIENRGQWDARARFLLDRGTMRVWFASDAVVYDVGAAAGARHAVWMRFAGATPRGPVPAGIEPGRWSFGSAERTIADVSACDTLHYDELYPGIGARYYESGGRLKYDLILSPGADPASICMRYDGASSVGVARDGSLRLGTSVGRLREDAPFCYQRTANGIRRVSCAFARNARGVGFRLGAYDRSRPLVIDPALIYSSYIGGNGDDEGRAVALDDSANIYVTGTTASADFPVKPGPRPAQANTDVFVARLDPTGRTLVYATLIGGSGNDESVAIRIASDGTAVVAGSTTSQNMFPNPRFRINDGDRGNGFVLGLKRNGALAFGTYVGGSDTDRIQDMTLATNDTIYVAGWTRSPDLPDSGPVGLAGGEDAFVMRIAPQAALLSTRYLGGAQDERATGVAPGSGGAVWITGWTGSNDAFRSDLPASKRAVFGNRGGRDCFLTRVWFNGLAAANEYVAVIGGSRDDEANAIAVTAQNSTDQITITGRTLSDDYFTTVAGAYGSWFVSTMQWTLGTQAIIYSEYLAPQDSTASGMAVENDASGNPFICGVTRRGASFPVTPDAVANPGSRGNADLAFVRLGPAGAVVHAGVVGGALDDIPAHRCVLTRFGDMYVTGATGSANFPLTRGAYDSTLNTVPGSTASDAFLQRYGFIPHPALVAPPVFQLRTLQCGSVEFDTITIANLGDADLVIGGITPNAASTEFIVVTDPAPTPLAPAIVKPGNTLKLVVRFTANANGLQSGTITLSTNDSTLGRPPFTIQVSALRATPALNSSPSPIVFDTLSACSGHSDTLRASLSNGGSSVLHIDSLRLKGGGGVFGFSMPRLPLTVVVGTRLDLSVEFNPPGPGPFRDTLLVKVRECDTTIAIPVEGVAVKPSVALAPAEVQFLPCSHTDSAVIGLSNNGPEPLHIQSWALGTAAFALDSSTLHDVVPGHGSTSIVLRYRDTSGSAVRDTLRIHLDGCDTTLLVPISGGRSVALDATPAMLEFGPIAVCSGADAVDSVLTLSLGNGTSESIQVDGASLDPPFALDASVSFPALLPGGSAMQIPVHFRPAANGAASDTLRLMYSYGECRDTLRLALHGLRGLYSLTASRDTLDLGTLSGCRHDTADTVLLRNNSPVPLVITRADVSQGVVLDSGHTLPDTLAPGDVRVARLRLVSAAPGDIGGRIAFRTDACNDSLVVTLRAHKEGVAFAVTPDTLHPAPREACRTDETLDSVVVRNTGSDADITIIDASLETGTPFELGGGIVGAVLHPHDAFRVPVRFRPAPPGLYAAHLRLILGPCGDTIVRVVVGEIAGLDLLVKTIDFGPVPQGSAADGTILVINQGATPMHLNGIGGIAAPYAVVPPSPFPATLNPGDTLRVVLSFAPTDTLGHRQILQVVGGNACTDSVAFSVNGTGVGAVGGRDTFCIGTAVQQGLVGDTITLSAGALSTPRAFPPANLLYTVRYPGSRMQFVDVLPLVPSSPMTVVSDNPATGLLQLSEPQAVATRPEQFRLRFRLLAGPEQFAYIQLVSAANATTLEAFNVCGDSERVVIADRCIVTGLTTGKYANLLEPLLPNPADAVVEVTYQQLEDARAILRVVDLFGREMLRPLDADMKGGRYTLRFNAEDLPSGTYFLTIEAGTYNDARRLVIRR
ncbi:MAG TPA: choice-of-anchor D domain-containing protein [Candidatus Kapabacteria bacterium]|nr:choice-of-anchor D domain-containing protein [Candidatus Kapabacteria bacterium]